MDFTQEIQKHVVNYYDWLKQKTQVQQVDNKWVQIVTPYLDAHNDYFIIYVKKENNHYLLTDGGYVIENLFKCKNLSEKQSKFLEITLNCFGIFLDWDCLTVRASSENFSIKKHNLLQAMMDLR